MAQGKQKDWNFITAPGVWAVESGGFALAEEALSHATAPRYSPFLAQVTVQHKSSVLPVNMVSKVIV